MSGKEPGKEHIAALAKLRGVELKGGKLHTAVYYEDAGGEPHIKVMVDFGIGGIAKMTASMRELEVSMGEAEPSLEMLEAHQLRDIAERIGVSISGARFNKVKVIVAIRKKLLDLAASEIASEEAEGEEEGETVELEDYTKAELIAHAADIGAEVKKSWSNQKMVDAIYDYLEAPEPEGESE